MPSLYRIIWTILSFSLAMAISGPGDSVLVPTPTYPIHTYAFILANADVISVPLSRDVDFFEELLKAFKANWPRPKALIINFHLYFINKKIKAKATTKEKINSPKEGTGSPS